MFNVKECMFLAHILLYTFISSTIMHRVKFNLLRLSLVPLLIALTIFQLPENNFGDIISPCSALMWLMIAVLYIVYSRRGKYIVSYSRRLLLMTTPISLLLCNILLVLVYGEKALLSQIIVFSSFILIHVWEGMTKFFK